MTPKQRRFADEYLIDCNAIRAYKAAYPHVKNDDVAKVNGSRMLTFANVRAYIDKKLEEISSAKIADAIEVMERQKLRQSTEPAKIYAYPMQQNGYTLSPCE